MLLALLFATVAVNAQQPYEIMRTQNGTMVYSVGDGTWLTREDWIQKFGRKNFRYNFPYPNYYDHMVEQGYIRTYVQKTFNLLAASRLSNSIDLSDSSTRDQ